MGAATDACRVGAPVGVVSVIERQIGDSNVCVPGRRPCSYGEKIASNMLPIGQI